MLMNKAMHLCILQRNERRDCEDLYVDSRVYSQCGMDLSAVSNSIMLSWAQRALNALHPGVYVLLSRPFINTIGQQEIQQK